MEVPMPGYEGRLATADEMANGLLASVRYIKENGEKYGVDPSKIVLEGCSGGGYAVSAACGRLAKLGESSLVKVAIIIQPVAPGYYHSTKKDDMPDNMTKMALYDGPYVV